MSDREDEINLKEEVIEVTKATDIGSEPDIGACGGDHLRSFSPLSDSVDNLSLEVQFEDESSRHPSEISTLSYQNLLDDCDGSVNVLSRQESEDSIDSFPPDYGDCFPQDSLSKCDLRDLPSAISEKYEENFTKNDFQRLSKEKMIESDDQFKDISLNEVENFDEKSRSGANNVSGVEYRQSRQSSEEIESVKKRNSLEIRNNIPVIGEIKSYEKDLDKVSYNSQGAKPKIRKQSPGLACRVGDGSTGSGSDREGSSSERETDKITKNKNLKHNSNDRECSSSDCEMEKGELKNTDRNNSDKLSKDDSGNEDENEVIELVKITNKRPANLIQPHLREPQDIHCEKTHNGDSLEATMKSVVDLGSKTEHVNGHNNVVMLGQGQSNDVENEYDYVKYARVQDGNSYVGMRLAYSSTDDSKRNSLAFSGLSNNSTDVSRENSPEKTVANLQKMDFSNSAGLENVNDELLTEIPLDTSDSPHTEDKQAFSLSPENTECDSVEVESVTSDGDRSNMGMPLVEDGLSSSQTSDIEDGLQISTHKSPTVQLREKQKAEIAQELEQLEKQYNTDSKPKEMDAEAIMEDLKAKREALDIAIADIKSAIQNSKGVSLQSPYKDDLEEEPIWVKRESFTEQTKRKEELEKVRDELNRLQEEELRKKEEKVFEMENEKDKLLENQYCRNDGKLYQAPKGYDSDDEEEGVKYTRRMKGKKYASVPKDDSFDHGPSQAPALNGSNHNRMHSDCSSDSNEYNYTKRNRLHSESDSEEFGSDVEAPSKTTYMKQKTGDFDTDEETDILLQKQYQKDSHVDIPELTQPPINRSAQQEKRKSRAKEGEKESLSINDPENPSVLIEGVLFRAKYLGSTQLISEGQPSKAMRMMQAQEAVGRIKTLGTLHFGTKFQNQYSDDKTAGEQTAAAKQGNPPAESSGCTEKAPEGENQPSTPVDLFVSTEKIMVLNTDLQEIMMDHSLRTISYIADIGEILVIMARRRILSSPGEDSLRRKKQAKILCHVFESEEAQLIAQSIGQAFQVAYMEFLKANGIEDPTLMKEIDYQEVLNQQEIYGEELNLFANKELHKEVIVPKLKSEHLGVVIVESGWGSMVPTVVLANLCPNGPAARCGQLNIGDQIISINGISLVGLPLSACQTYIKNSKTQTVVKLTVVPCPPVVEVLIKRPDVKYQLGFSVQNGVICSLLRGGIAERGGVRVGHRIIEINNQSVVAVPHEKIVSLLANSVGEIHMKTMPTSIFRLLTGQETPHYL